MVRVWKELLSHQQILDGAETKAVWQSPLSHVAWAMGDAAEPRGASSAFSRTWQLILAPWSEAQRAALRRFGNDESSVLLFALRTDGGKLEVFVTCKTPRRAAWLSTHVVEGEWPPKTALARARDAQAALG
jgi:hypothetical protein